MLPDKSIVFGSTPTHPVPGECLVVPSGIPCTIRGMRGLDLETSLTVSDLVDSFSSVGIQASQLSKAADVLKAMLASRDDASESGGCTIFLAYTSNMVSSGVREWIKFLVDHKYVDVLVTSAGGVEEDFVKSLEDANLGTFDYSTAHAATLRAEGNNMIGNIVMPNKNYCAFESWVVPVIERLHDNQEKGVRQLVEKAKNSKSVFCSEEIVDVRSCVTSPSLLIAELALSLPEDKRNSSVYYSATTRGIPVFCPGITDGSLGDILYFYDYKRSGFVVDVARDVRRINDIAVRSKKTGVIVLGGGTPKHHVMNANLMRNGADFAVFISTATAYDASDSGAPLHEAITWGKLKPNAQSAKVFCDASIAFPLLVSSTFHQHHLRVLNSKQSRALVS